MSSIVFKKIEYNSTDWREAVLLREKILRVPLGARFLPEELAEEEKHIHIAGYRQKRIVATSVLVPLSDEMKVQRVVVADDERSQGIGGEMMRFCEHLSIQSGRSLMYCHARDSAVDFYQKNGWTEEGEYFDEDGIPHVKMVKHLAK